MAGITVHVRVRPGTAKTSWAMADTVLYATERQEARFVFNKVHSTASNNQSMFHSVEPVLYSSFHEGRSVTVMAYGQTGSGKTHTMMGTPRDEGIIPRTARLLLDLAANTPGTVIKASCCEIYNEAVRDLLVSADQSRAEIQLREGADGSVIFDRVMSTISSYADFVIMKTRAEKARQTGVTDLNSHSSRSHMILSFTVQRPDRAQAATIYMVDLAGSESAARANTDGAQLREGGFINKSLLSLGNVVDAIVEGRGHIPYRESKLTRLLRNCLGGSGLTFIVATVNPEPESFDQTVCALRFAQRAMKMKADPTQMISMIPFAAFDFVQRKAMELQQYHQRCSVAYQQGLGQTYVHCLPYLTERAGHLQEEMFQAGQQWNRAKLLLYAREKLNHVRALRDVNGRAAQFQEDNQRAVEEERRHSDKLRDVIASMRAATERAEVMEQLAADKEEQCRSLAEENEFAYNERVANLYAQDSYLEDQEATAREELDTEETRQRSHILEACLQPFQSMQVAGGAERQARIQQFQETIEAEKQDIVSLEAAYELLAEDETPGPDVLDTLPDDAFDARVMALEEEHQQLASQMVSREKFCRTSQSPLHPIVDQHSHSDPADHQLHAPAPATGGQQGGLFAQAADMLRRGVNTVTRAISPPARTQSSAPAPSTSMPLQAKSSSQVNSTAASQSGPAASRGNKRSTRPIHIEPSLSATENEEEYDCSESSANKRKKAAKAAAAARVIAAKVKKTISRSRSKSRTPTPKKLDYIASKAAAPTPDVDRELDFDTSLDMGRQQVIRGRQARKA